MESNAESRGGHAATEKHLEQVIAELIGNGSIELSQRDDLTLNDSSELLPYGTSVYLPALPKQSLLSNLDSVRAIHAAGYDPVVHLAARRIISIQELRDFLDRVTQDYGVHRVLLIGGDLPQPMGPYADSAAILREDVLAEAGISEVGFAAYPEGHPRVSTAALNSALEQKLALAAASGLGTYVVTQFSFAPSRTVEYCTTLERIFPELPVYIGMPGPVNAARLLRYAKRCGISESLRALSATGFQAARLVMHTDPREQLVVFARYRAARETSNVVGVHLFSFGGFYQSARWMRGMFGAGE